MLIFFISLDKIKVMKVILLENVTNLGNKSDVLEVSDGYALNFLIPKGKARFADEGTIEKAQRNKEDERKRKDKELKHLMEELDSISGKSLNIKREASEEGHLFAGLGKKDILKAINDEFKTSFVESNIKLEKPIKETGKHQVNVGVGDREESVEVIIES